ncbi:hypothetical protein [Calothrix sp. PCC 7507]|uniref:hypothetical protein n=1 Tax=Calothrix sp. PCC 7507 TaxID=99598 RepID=UPI0002E71CF9|nr:hypothetical protein [Calothrix sp. PCC 7507]
MCFLLRTNQSRPTVSSRWGAFQFLISGDRTPPVAVMAIAQNKTVSTQRAGRFY